MKSVSLERYFEVVRPEYVYLRLIPLKSIRNYDSDKIALAIASTYKSILQRIRRQDKKYFFHVQSKVAYYIYIEKCKVEFYFLIPREYLTLIKDKIGDTWRSITIQQVDNIPTFEADTLRYSMGYRKEDALSLASDKRSNTLLTSLMSTIDIMEDGDKVGLFYNFIPCDQMSWRAQYDNTLEKLKRGVPIDKEKSSALFAVKLLAKVLVTLSEFITDAVADLTGGRAPQPITVSDITLLPETKRKRDARVVKAQIVAFSQSTDPNRRQNNVIALGEGYKSISGDNELIYRRITRDGGADKDFLSRRRRVEDVRRRVRKHGRASWAGALGAVQGN